MEKKLSVLLVDDDPLVLTCISKGLKRAGFNITPAKCGYEALDLAKKNNFDVVLLDINMPDISGIQVAKQLDLSSCPVIFFTANSDEKHLGEAQLDGCYGYLVKPMNIKQILPAISIALERFNHCNSLSNWIKSLERTEQANRSVSMAIGLIMERHHISEEDAFKQLRDHSRNTRKSIKELAEGIVEAFSLVNTMHITND